MTPLMPPSSLELSDLDELYRFYNSRKWVHPDPLEFLYRYPDPKDREIVGLLASCLAYGRVRQILKSVSAALEKLGQSPHAFVLSASPGRLKRSFANFRHRFTTGDEFTALLIGLKEVVLRHGSLYRCFLRGSRPEDDTVLPAISSLIHEIKALSGRNGSDSMIPLPEKGSACKRLNLFLRWMVREDRVDPGGWDRVESAKLIVPLDTHMYRISLELGLTRRKSADIGDYAGIPEDLPPGSRAFRLCVDPARHSQTVEQSSQAQVFCSRSPANRSKRNLRGPFSSKIRA